MTNLEALELNENMLTGPIPSRLALLTNVYQLHLSEKALEGPIPTELGVI